jgi:hypothetical protein
VRPLAQTFVKEELSKQLLECTQEIAKYLPGDARWAPLRLR